MIVLHPPAGLAPFKAIKLQHGTVFPDFDAGGRVKVADEQDALELESEGWVRDTASRQAKAVANDLLQKGMSCQLRRSHGASSPPLQRSRMPSDSELLQRGLAAQIRRGPGTGDPDPDRKIEIGEVETQLGRVRVTHSSTGSISLHGVHTMLSEIDADLRQAIVATSASFAAAATDQEQSDQRAVIGIVVDAVLRRHQFLTAKVREAKLRERYDV